ncbi:DUF4261 domain-containing protein [Roseateles chitinivorans]|uniref:DUF4261 domain-containing protein n=1 Tax=Roseateles chitinivorans TaxID=2917965 RepID=UPI003D67FA8D
MNTELLLCIPGPWKDRSDFIQSVITHVPMGRYMFAGGILADVHDKEHVIADFTSADPKMSEAFEIAGQGRIAAALLSDIEKHQSVVYLHFQGDVRAERDRLIKFTRLLQQFGGYGIKVESAGVAHAWDRWFSLLEGSLFDLYCASVVLIGGEEHYYSCGMHHFGLPDCAVPTSVDVGEAADLMNRFNYWQIDEGPALGSGHTFSLSQDEPVWRLTLESDERYEAEDPFFNPHGMWVLNPA